MILTIIMTSLVYILANGFTYHIGTSKGCCGNEPLHDVLHHMLPDISKWVWIRDIVLISLWIPFIIYIKGKLEFLKSFTETFLWVVFIKALLIFFTFIPPSNRDCLDKRYLNHCYHNAVSGHAAMAYILCFLYYKYSLINRPTATTIVLLYGLLIVLTRAHYTKDVLEALVVVTLMIY